VAAEQGGTTVGNTDLLVKDETDYEDEPARISGRRIARWVIVLTVGIFAVLAVWQDPLHALHS
jgi:hypothetical protein